jgi:hypothetical protein
MLSWRCRRFRARFSPADLPGAGSRHRRSCADCDAYATTLERIAAARLPLPERLRGELSRLSGGLAGGLLPGPVPALALPSALRARLQGLARGEAARRPPEWIASPRYAIAASLLLTTLSAALLGNPQELAARAASFVNREMTPPLTQARQTGKEELRTWLTWRETAASRLTVIRRDIGGSFQGMENRVTELAGRLLPAPPNENRGRASEAPGGVRRKP